jgi:aldehyde:ferredoxin oxidoreductase
MISWKKDLKLLRADSPPSANSIEESTMNESEKKKGFHNKILTIDLTNQSFSTSDLSDIPLEKTLGGKGLATHLLLKLNPVGCDPLSPENHLIIATGPITQSPIHGGSRYGVFTKSPQTGLYSESYSGGHAPEAISRTGHDVVILQGASEKPVALEISETGVVFHDATDLWGKDTYETEEMVLERWGTVAKGAKKSGAIVIGPAGENQVRFAVIENDKWRSAGRTGVGTVMGAKKVKAMVFNGEVQRKYADADGLKAFVKECSKRIKDTPIFGNYRKFGTPMLVDLVNEVGAFPNRYWSKGKSALQDKINAPAMQEVMDVKPKACAHCSVACGKLSTIKSGPHEGLTVEGPEYETIYAFGGLCEIGSIEEITYLNDLCDRLGMDTISAGNLCAFTMEACVRGKIDEKICYGDAEAAADLLKKMAAREGIGKVLAEGIVSAAKRWGMEDVAIHVKGLEPAGFDPRTLKGMGLGYAVSPRGACHMRATFYKPELFGQIPPEQIKGKAELFKDYEDRLTLMDCLIVCRFYRDLYMWDEMAKIVELTTGMQLDQKGMEKAADHVVSIVREFNLREGMTLTEESLPERFSKEPLENGDVITPEELETMRSEYYELRGLDTQGRIKT